MVVVGNTVLYVTRRQATKRDPQGMGDPTLPDDPLQYKRLPALVARVISPTVLDLIVASVPTNFARRNVAQFNAGTPKWGTWEAVV